MLNIEQLIAWLTNHPHYGQLLTFIVALAESLIIIGGIIPGSLIISAIGALAGSGILPIYSTLLCAILGAICGDFASFFIGRHFKDKLRNFIFFRKHPNALNYGEAYFKKNGAKSVFFARFIGPIRAIVPAIAGMLDMKVRHFIIANSISAIGWAFLFFYPGTLINLSEQDLRSNFRQIAASLLVIAIPIALIKLIYSVKKIIPKIYQEQALWLALTIATCISFIMPLTYPKLAIYNIIEKYFIHFNVSNTLSVLVFTVFCLTEKLLPYLIVILLIATPLFYLSSIKIGFILLVIAIQYLILRKTTHQPTKYNQYYYIIFALAWFLTAYILNMLSQLLLTLSLTQLAWLALARFTNQKHSSIHWTNLVVLSLLAQKLVNYYLFCYNK